MKTKLLTNSELMLIEREIDEIAAEMEWLDPNILGEETRIDRHKIRLAELIEIIEKSLVKARIHELGLRIVS